MISLTLYRQLLCAESFSYSFSTVSGDNSNQLVSSLVLTNTLYSSTLDNQLNKSRHAKRIWNSPVITLPYYL